MSLPDGFSDDVADINHHQLLGYRLVTVRIVLDKKRNDYIRLHYIFYILEYNLIIIYNIRRRIKSDYFQQKNMFT